MTVTADDTIQDMMDALNVARGGKWIVKNLEAEAHYGPFATWPDAHDWGQANLTHAYTVLPLFPPHQGV